MEQTFADIHEVEEEEKDDDNSPEDLVYSYSQEQLSTSTEWNDPELNLQRLLDSINRKYHQTKLKLDLEKNEHSKTKLELKTLKNQSPIEKPQQFQSSNNSKHSLK